MTESATSNARQPGNEVLVEVSGCDETDAQSVFEVLRASFASDRAAGDVPHKDPGGHPTVWAATLDTGGALDAGPAVGAARAPRLTEQVTLDVQGGYHAVDVLRATLSSAFTVHLVGTASGDQENEVQLRLESGPPR